MRQTTGGVAETPQTEVSVKPWAKPNAHPRMVARAIVEEAKKSGIIRKDADQRATGLIEKVIEEAIRTAAETVEARIHESGYRHCNHCNSYVHTDTAALLPPSTWYCDDACQKKDVCSFCGEYPRWEDCGEFCSFRCRDNHAAELYIERGAE